MSECKTCGLPYAECGCDWNSLPEVSCLSCGDDPNICRELGVCDIHDEDTRLELLK